MPFPSANPPNASRPPGIGSPFNPGAGSPPTPSATPPANPSGRGFGGSNFPSANLPPTTPSVPPQGAAPAQPPPTPRGSGLYPPQGQSGIPAAVPRQPLPRNPLPGARPPGLPNPIGGGAGAVFGAGAAIDFAGRMVAGQPLGQAAGGAIASGAGGAIGFAAGTAVAGPLGGFIGGAVGSWAGGAAYDALFSPPASPPEIVPPPQGKTPFKGGGSSNIYYQFLADEYYSGDAENHVFSQIVAEPLWGPLSGFGQEDYIGGDGRTYTRAFIYGKKHHYSSVEKHVVHEQYKHPRARWDYENPRTEIIQYVNGATADDDRDPPPDPIPRDPRSPQSQNYPPAQGAGIPRGYPGAGQTDPPPRNYPSPIPQHSPRGDNPYGYDVPHGDPGASGTPSPAIAPRSPMPGVGNPAPPVPATGYTPPAVGGGLPQPNSAPPDLDAGYPQPNALPGTSAQRPPDTFAFKSPGVPPAPAPSAPTERPSVDRPPEAVPEPIKPPAEKKLDDIEKQIKEQNDKLIEMGIILAGLTTLLKGSPLAQSPADLENTIANGVCKTTQPGGCTANQFDNVNAGNLANGNKLDALNTALNGLDLASSTAMNSKLDTINNKLGNQVPGGISGKLERLSKWLHLDRVLNILVWWQTLHNAYMLSNNLGQTLTSAISNVLAAIGIKDAEGSPLNINEILGKQFDELAKGVLGEETWGDIKAEWKKYNRIYQAAANVLYSLQSIGSSILSALEVVGTWVAWIGNALRKWGEVGERAYNWMNPNVNFQNRFFTSLERATDFVAQIDTVASEVLSVQETVKQLGDQKKELDDSLKQVDNSTRTPSEAEKIKKEAEDSKTVSVSPEINITDTRKDTE